MYANAALCVLLGRTKGELLSAPLAELLCGSDLQPPAAAALQRALRTGEEAVLELVSSCAARSAGLSQ